MSRVVTLLLLLLLLPASNCMQACRVAMSIISVRLGLLSTWQCVHACSSAGKQGAKKPETPP